MQKIENYFTEEDLREFERLANEDIMKDELVDYEELIASRLDLDLDEELLF